MGQGRMWMYPLWHAAGSLQKAVQDVLDIGEREHWAIGVLFSSWCGMLLGAEGREGDGHCSTILVFQNEDSLFPKSATPQETAHLYHSQEAGVDGPPLAFTC